MKTYMLCLVRLGVIVIMGAGLFTHHKIAYGIENNNSFSENEYKQETRESCLLKGQKLVEKINYICSAADSPISKHVIYTCGDINGPSKVENLCG